MLTGREDTAQLGDAAIAPLYVDVAAGWPR